MTRTVGDRGVLLEFADNEHVHAATRAARQLYGDLLEEVVAGHETLLLVWRDGSVVPDVAELARERVSFTPSTDDSDDPSVAVVRVIYDGADLNDVASRLGVTRDGIVDLHSEAEYVVAFMGFSPGFPYLLAAGTAGDVAPLLAAPRLASPRTQVPAGSVAIAAGYCGIYPQVSPGGWNLLGHTDAVLFDPERAQPALLEPGMRVRFTAVEMADRPEPRGDLPPLRGSGSTQVEVVSPGAFTTIQDLGRPGWAHVGVPPSGAADPAALALANQLVGNDPGAPALETTLVGPRLRALEETVVAITGAPVGGVAMHTAIRLRCGEELRTGTARSGLHSYIAFAGGIDVPLVLGSAATDVLTGLGPAPLAAGDRLSLSSPARVTGTSGAKGTLSCAFGPRSAEGSDGVTELPILWGPREDWFTAQARETLISTEFTVTPASNRIGLRLSGPRLQHAHSGELPSEGLVAGAIQVPPDGQPILLLNDHPTTGGYPVIAVVSSAAICRAGQLRPGQRIRFAAADHG